MARFDLQVTPPGADSRTRDVVTVSAVSSAAAVGLWVQGNAGGVVWAWRAAKPRGETINAGAVIDVA